MVQGNGYLVIDFGNSSTKCTVMCGKNPKTGRYYKSRFELSNTFGIIKSEDYEVSPDYNTETSAIIKVDTEGAKGRRICGLFCNGDLQRSECKQGVIKPGSFAKKYDLDSTYLSIRLAFLRAFEEIAKMRKLRDVESRMDIRWTVVTMLPPGDIDVGKDKLAEIIKGVTEVESIYPKMKFPVTVDSVHVFAEGFCGYVACVYDEGMTYRDSHKELLNGSVLIMDIGDGTTDIMVIENNKMIQKSKHTLPQGGRNVFLGVKRALLENGDDLSDENIQEGILNGEFKVGRSTFNIVPQVNDAKRNVANVLVSSFEEYITENSDIKLQSIGYVLVLGGGSMSSETNKDIVTLGDVIIETIQRYSPHATLVELPMVTSYMTNEDGEQIREEKVISARLLNLLGASILAEVV